MHPLHVVIASRATVAVVSMLFGAPHRPVHVREMARRAGLSEAVMRRELRRLADLGLLEAHRDANRLSYRACWGHPLSRDLRSMVTKSIGIVEALRTALRDPQIDLVIAHGPEIARITEFGCPLRLLIIGIITRSKAERMLGMAAREFARRIEIDVMSPRDVARRHDRGALELPSPRVFVIGSERQLAVALAWEQPGASRDIGVFLGPNSRKPRKSRR